MIQGYRTFIGILISAVPTLATFLGFDTAPNFVGDATEIAGAIVTLIGAGVAIYGRLKAETPGWFAKKQ